MTATIVALGLGLWMIVAFGLSLLIGGALRYCRQWDEKVVGFEDTGKIAA